MPLPRFLGTALVALVLLALVAGCASSGPRESTSDLINNSTTVTNATTPTLPGFNTTAAQGETPIIAPPGP